MKKQVAKSQIFTKESLTRIQDKMRNCCIKSFNKVYEQDYQLKTKEKGKNQDIPVSQMLNYNKVKKQYEKNKKLLEQANKKTDLVNENGNNIKEIVSNLKPKQKELYYFTRTSNNYKRLYFRCRGYYKINEKSK